VESRRQSAHRSSDRLAAAIAIQVVAPVTALADAANPVGAATGTETSNVDGTVTVALGGTWTWSGQKCANRYGLGWAVDWWGTSASNASSPNFSLNNATVVAPTGSGPHAWSSSVVRTGTVSYAGSIRIGRRRGRPRGRRHPDRPRGRRRQGHP
jgi:hypothetical protein